MPFREGFKPNQPFTVSPKDLVENFRMLTATEVRKMNAGIQDKRIPKKEGKTTMDQAEKIFGNEFFGPEAVKKAFGIDLQSKQIPEIPFSTEELERAKELGQFLVLRVSHGPDGQPLTMPTMHEMLQPHFTQSGKGKVLFNTTDEWKVKSTFFTAETPRAGWALTSKTPIPESKNKNYLAQTHILAEYITTEVFKNRGVPPEYQAALDEFTQYVDRTFTGKTPKQITALLGGSDWARYAGELEALQINQLTRQSPADALYDMLMYYQNTGEKILESEFTWTNRRTSDGGLVFVGFFGADGARVGGWLPGGSNADLGVSFSRSL